MMNVDNVSGEVIPYLIETTIERGAKNVHVVPAITKKGRPEYLIFVDVSEENLENVVGFLLAELGSLGYRILRAEHFPAEYEIEQFKVNLGTLNLPMDIDVRIKVIRRPDGSLLTANVEYEDLRALADHFDNDSSRFPMMKLKSMIEGKFIEQHLENRKKPSDNLVISQEE